MEFIVLLPLAWLYAAINLIHIAYKIFCMRREPQGIWRFPSTGQLLRYTFGYAVTAPTHDRDRWGRCQR